MECVELATCPGLAGEDSGEGWDGEGNSSSQTSEGDGLGEALKYHHSVGWHKATQIEQCLLEVLSS